MNAKIDLYFAKSLFVKQRKMMNEKILWKKEDLLRNNVQYNHCKSEGGFFNPNVEVSTYE